MKETDKFLFVFLVQKATVKGKMHKRMREGERNE
jgi:hypothetical protein